MKKPRCARLGCNALLSSHDIANGIVYCSRMCGQAGEIDSRNENINETEEDE